MIGTAYYSAAIALNVVVTLMVTSMICIHIWPRKRQFQEPCGRETSRQLIGVTSFIIESALPRTVIGLIFLIAFALDSDVSVTLLSLYVMLAVGSVFLVFGFID